LQLRPRWKRNHFDPISGCLTESLRPRPAAGLALLVNIGRGDHGLIIGQRDTMKSVNVEEQQQDSHSSPLEAWRLNSCSGDPSGLGTSLSKQLRAYFSKEMKKATMGNHFLVQQAFNMGVHLRIFPGRSEFSSQSLLKLPWYYTTK
jgi:hypothetical protein